VIIGKKLTQRVDETECGSYEQLVVRDNNIMKNN